MPASGRSSIMVSMNRLSTEKRAQIIGCLVEGNSIRATVRMTGAAKNTIAKLLVDLGASLRRVPGRDAARPALQWIECDEIWAYCYAKQKNVPEQSRARSATATCGRGRRSAPTPSSSRHGWSVSAPRRTRRRSCATSRPGWRTASSSPPTATSSTQATVGPPSAGDIDYAHAPQDLRARPPARRAANTARPSAPAPRRACCTATPTRPISTSYVERQNLTMRMGMRRFTRLTNGFSKKVENLAHAVSLHYMHYNFARPHKTLSRTRLPDHPGDGGRRRRSRLDLTRSPRCSTGISQMSGN